VKIERLDLLHLRLPLIRPFETSSSRKDHIEHILVRAHANGLVGWGECASPSDPYYCPETVETARRRWRPAGTFCATFSPLRCWASTGRISRSSAPATTW